MGEKLQKINKMNLIRKTSIIIVVSFLISNCKGISKENISTSSENFVIKNNNPLYSLNKNFIFRYKPLSCSVPIPKDLTEHYIFYMKSLFYSSSVEEKLLILKNYYSFLSKISISQSNPNISAYIEKLKKRCEQQIEICRLLLKYREIEMEDIKININNNCPDTKSKLYMSLQQRNILEKIVSYKDIINPIMYNKILKRYKKLIIETYLMELDSLIYDLKIEEGFDEYIKKLLKIKDKITEYLNNYKNILDLQYIKNIELHQIKISNRIKHERALYNRLLKIQQAKLKEQQKKIIKKRVICDYKMAKKLYKKGKGILNDNEILFVKALTFLDRILNCKNQNYIPYIIKEKAVWLHHKLSQELWVDDIKFYNKIKKLSPLPDYTSLSDYPKWSPKTVANNIWIKIKKEEKRIESIKDNKISYK